MSSFCLYLLKVPLQGWGCLQKVSTLRMTSLKPSPRSSILVSLRADAYALESLNNYEMLGLGYPEANTNQ